MYHLLFSSLLHIPTSKDVTVFLRYLIVCSVNSKEFGQEPCRLEYQLIQWWSLLYIVKDNGVPG